jgi:hypothetical protein
MSGVVSEVPDAALAQVRSDGRQLAADVLKHAAGEVHIALAILGVAAVEVCKAGGGVDAEGAALLNEWLASFERGLMS